MDLNSEILKLNKQTKIKLFHSIIFALFCAIKIYVLVDFVYGNSISQTDGTFEMNDESI